MTGCIADVDAERALLGAILLDSSRCEEVQQHIGSDDFSLLEHVLIFYAMAEMLQRGKVADIVTLSKEFSSDVLARVGGVAYLASLTDGLPRRVDLMPLVYRIQKAAMMRMLVEQASELATPLVVGKGAISFVPTPPGDGDPLGFVPPWARNCDNCWYAEVGFNRDPCRQCWRSLRSFPLIAGMDDKWKSGRHFEKRPVKK